MRRYIYFILILFSLQNLWAMEDYLPADEVKSYRDQMDLFIKAYQGLDPQETDLKNKHIEGLTPMVRMHYSHMHNLVKNSPEHVKLLKDFWDQTSQTIQDKKMTIVRMKATALQLSMLLFDFKGWKFTDNPNFVSMHENESWKKVESFEEYALGTMLSSFIEAYFSSPFQYEAVFCGGDGVIPYDMFIEGYTAHPFWMHLSSMSDNGKGPHGDTYEDDPTNFLTHDYSHGSSFAFDVRQYQEKLLKNPDTAHLKYWETLRELVRTIDKKGNSEDKKLNDIALFLLLHEVKLSLNAEDKEDGFKLLDLSKEEAELPLSMRQLFRNAVAEAVSDSTREALFYGVPGLLRQTALDPSTWERLGLLLYEKFPHHPMKNANGSFTQPIVVRHGDFRGPEAGSFDVTFTLSPLADSKNEEITITQATQPVWNSGTDVSEQTKKSFTSFIKPPISATGLGRPYFYSVGVQDNENMLRDLYGNDHGLLGKDATLEDRQAAVHKRMIRFWKEFYQKNKHLFSDTGI